MDDPLRTTVRLDLRKCQKCHINVFPRHRWQPPSSKFFQNNPSPENQRTGPKVQPHNALRAPSVHRKSPTRLGSVYRSPDVCIQFPTIYVKSAHQIVPSSALNRTGVHQRALPPPQLQRDRNSPLPTFTCFLLFWALFCVARHCRILSGWMLLSSRRVSIVVTCFSKVYPISLSPSAKNIGLVRDSFLTHGRFLSKVIQKNVS